MVPSKDLNIYPKTKKNVMALISYYFDEYDLSQEGAVEKVMNTTSLSLNQFEFIIRKLSEAYKVVFEPKPINASISNLIRYGIDGLTKHEDEWSLGPNSTGRPIIKNFIEFVKQSESN